MISRRDCLRSSSASLLALSLGACKPTTAASPASPSTPPPASAAPTASAASAAASAAPATPAASTASAAAAPFSVRTPIFVLNSLDATLSVIDPLTMTELRRVPTGKEPHHLYLSPDEK